MGSVSLTNREILKLNTGLHAASKLHGVKFAYAVARNISYLEPIVIDLVKKYEPSEEYKEYEKSLAILNKKISENKDSDNDNVEKKVSLMDRNKNVIMKRSKQLDDFENLADEEVEVQLHLVKATDLPNDITADIITQILPIIKE